MKRAVDTTPLLECLSLFIYYFSSSRTVFLPHRAGICSNHRSRAFPSFFKTFSPGRFFFPEFRSDDLTKTNELRLGAAGTGCRQKYLFSIPISPKLPKCTSCPQYVYDFDTLCTFAFLTTRLRKYVQIVCTYIRKLTNILLIF